MAALFFFFNGKEILQHTHRQSLAEAPRPRNQGYGTVLIDEPTDEVRLIDKVIVFIPYFLKIINANRHLPHGLHLLP